MQRLGSLPTEQSRRPRGLSHWSSRQWRSNGRRKLRFAGLVATSLLVAVGTGAIMAERNTMRWDVDSKRSALDGLSLQSGEGGSGLPGPTSGPSLESLRRELRETMRRRDTAAARLDAKLPRTRYIVIGIAENRLDLRQNTEIIRRAVCSTGSFDTLQGPNGEQWRFRTPQGVRRVQGKVTNPVWTKPDWAFVEEGKAIPPPIHPDRFERGPLGAYALQLGDGYLIHGTLYERLLGLPVTHGCVRLGKEDLQVVYEASSVGTPVFVY